MERKEAIKELLSIVGSLENAMTGIRRKHWRDSEKAMALAATQRKVDAVQMAVTLLTLKED